MYERHYALPKMSLDKYLKSAVSVYPSTSNMVNRSKHYLHLNGGTFPVFIDH